jgi:hypothetical protein
VSIIGTAPFGFGMMLVFLGIVNYLVDAYVIYAASVLAANTVLRCMFGAGFPLFTNCKLLYPCLFPSLSKSCFLFVSSTDYYESDMYQNLGIHWASSIPAFLSLACVPFPFLLYKYGATIRLKCKYSAEAAAILEELRQDDARDEFVEDEKSEEIKR